MARSKLISESGLFSMMLKDARSSWSFVVLASKSECESESGEKRSGSEMGLLAPTLTPALFSAPWLLKVATRHFNSSTNKGVGINVVT
jgi:hypothetical protein